MKVKGVNPKRVVQGIQSQPLMKIFWVSRDKLKPNLYNPNEVAPPELSLLKVSIMEDGWTQPIVARKDGQIVDGFHRWAVAGDQEVSKMTDGKIPVVYLDDGVDPCHQMMSTIRHNRARGQHGILKLSDIVFDLQKQGLSREEIQSRLMMEEEEIERLTEKASMGSRFHKEYEGEFSRGWVPGKGGGSARD